MIGQEAHRERVIELAGRVFRAEARGAIREAQEAYDYLRGYCEGADIDFENAVRGARKHLQRRAVGILDSLAYGLMS